MINNTEELHNQLFHHSHQMSGQQFYDEFYDIQDYMKQYRTIVFNYIKDNNDDNKQKLQDFVADALNEEFLLKGTRSSEEQEKIKQYYASVMEHSIPMFSVNAVEHCNFKCKGCSNYSFLSPKNVFDVDSLNKVFTRYTEISNADDCVAIDILGGEPLLHPDIKGFCRTLRKFFPNTIIYLFTNGLLIPNQDISFAEMLRDENITLQVSIYGPQIAFFKYNLTHDMTKHVSCDNCMIHSPKDWVVYNDFGWDDWCFAERVIDKFGNIYYCSTCSNVFKLNDKYNETFNLKKDIDYMNIFEHNFDDILKMVNQKECAFSQYCGQMGYAYWDYAWNPELSHWTL